MARLSTRLFAIGDSADDLLTFDGVQQMSVQEMSLDAAGRRGIVATNGNTFGSAAANRPGSAVGVIGTDNGDPTVLILGHVTIVAPGGLLPVGIHRTAIGAGAPTRTRA